jgi:uncharacterized protein
VKLEDSFVVPVDPGVAWDALTDMARVAPCLPGAELVEMVGDEFHGLIKLKLGPIAVNYAGTAKFESLDPDRRRLVIVAKGRDSHGQGTASARVQAGLEEYDGGTRVTMEQEIAVTGKAAQFGRGILGDVSKQMMGQFAESLTEMLTAADQGPEGAAEVGETTRPSRPVSEPIDVGTVARGLAAQRLPEVTVALVLLAIAVFLRARRH